MKIKFLATGMAPDHYIFSGEVATAFHNGQSEDFDLSGLAEGDRFQAVGVDTLELAPGHVLRDAYRDGAGELHLTLCQQVGPGNWQEGEEFDVADYDPAKIHVIYDAGNPHTGAPWAITSEGKKWVS